MQPDAIVPVPSTQRLELLDSLRGFALAGVLFDNLTSFSLYIMLPRSAELALSVHAADRWLAPFDPIFVNSKFITLFSLLFGIGFSLQMQRNGDSSEGLHRYLRRLMVLFLIGLLHADLLWWGDILRYYALIGLLLVPLRHVRARTLAIVGVLLVVIPYPLVSTFWSGPVALVGSHDQAFAAALAALSSHRLTTMLQGNLAFNHWWIAMHWGQATWVAGCLLIGTALGRFQLIVFAVAGAIAGIAGALYVPVGFVSPDLFGLTFSTYVIVWMVLGGRGALIGGFVGAIGLSQLETALSGTFVTLWLLMVGVLLIIVVLIWPRGAIGALAAVTRVVRP